MSGDDRSAPGDQGRAPVGEERPGSGRVASPRSRVPGARIVRALSHLVPRADRAEWLMEWHSELLHDYQDRLARGESPVRARTRLRWRALASTSDVLFLRRSSDLPRAEQRRTPNRERAMSTLASDLRHALRSAVRRPGFSLLLTLTVALGVGATTAVFSVLDKVVLRPIPFPDAERLAEVWTFYPTSGFSQPYVSDELADFWGSRAHLFERAERAMVAGMTMTGAGDPRGVRAAYATPGLLAMLGAHPVAGRIFAEDEARAGAPDVVILGEPLARSRFGDARTAVGGVVRLDGKPFTVVGVLPETFKYPVGEHELYVPFRADTKAEPGRTSSFVLLTRVRPGLPPAAVKSEVAAIVRRMNAEQPRAQGQWDVEVKWLAAAWIGADARKAVWILAGAVACVLLIACVNAANLLLARASARETEMAIRSAIGATRARLVGQLLTESLVFAVVSGLLGVLLAWAGVRGIVALMPRDLRYFSFTPVGVDGRVLAFSLALTLATAITVGLGPALWASRPRGTVVGADRQSTTTRGHRRFRSGLVVGEIALAMVLLAGAGLLVNSFARLARTDPGFRVDDILVATLNLPPERYPDDARATAFFDRLAERVRAMPGVERVSVTVDAPPRTSIGFGNRIQAEGAAPLAAQPELLPFASVDTSYFATLGIPIVAGRAFAAADAGDASKPAIVSRGMAEALWGASAGGAVGRRFRTSEDGAWRTVVGVAEEVRLNGPDDRLGSYEMYLPAEPSKLGRYRSIVVRVRGAASPASLAGDVRRAVWAIDPELPVDDVAPMSALLADTVARPRFVLALMGAFAAVALVLAAVGIYGVISYVVAERSREIGIRMALGARSARILRDVLAGGMALAGLGVALGLLGAVGLSRFLASLLYGVGARDPLTLALVAAGLVMVAGVATLAPARRASRVEVVEVLR